MSRIVQSTRASWRSPRPGHGLPTLLTDEILRKLVIFCRHTLRGEHAQELRLRRTVVRCGSRCFGACLRSPCGVAVARRPRAWDYVAARDLVLHGNPPGSRPTCRDSRL